MSTDYKLVCYTCKCEMHGAFASGSIFYGFKVWDTQPMLDFLGHGQDVGLHEGHDLRIVSENIELPWGESVDEA
jgi:hypothetical protein